MMTLIFPLVVLLSWSAGASPVAIERFTGPRAKVAQAQVRKALCAELECVSSEDGSAAAVVTGVVVKKKRKPATLKVVVSVQGDRVFKKTFALGKSGRLWPDALSSISKATQSAVAEEEEADAPEAKAESAAQPAAEEAAVASVQAEPTDPRPEAVALEVSRPAQQPSSSSPSAPWLILTAGSDVMTRELSYAGPRQFLPRRYSSPVYVAPRVRLELHPLRAMVGISLEGDFSMAVGASSQLKDFQTRFPTSSTRVDAGARFHLTPVSPITLSAIGGYRMASFSLGKSTDGRTADGVPGVSYQAVRVGGALELRLGRMSIFAEGAYLPVFSSGEITKTLFPKGTASGAEAVAGLRFKIGGGFEVQASGTFTRYAFDLKPEADALYVASSAVDQYAGGALTLRYAL